MKGKVKFMFDINNDEYIKRCIDNRVEGGIVIPIYVDVYGVKYRIDEIMDHIPDIANNFYPGILKVGFGCLVCSLDKFSFPVRCMTEVSMLKCIETFDEVKNVDVNYFVFETNGLLGEDELHIQVGYYIDMIGESLNAKVKEYKEEMRKSKENNSSDV